MVSFDQASTAGRGAVTDGLRGSLAIRRGGAVANEEPNRSLLWPAVLVGIGVAGSLDEIVLHQLLRWHHFYDRGSRAAGLIADGIFHLGSTAALVVGLVLLVQRWRAGRGPLRQSVAGILLGAGGFNLYDGIVQHKLLGLHQVRAGAPNNLPYDAVFIGTAAVVLLGGLLLLRAAGSPGRPAASRQVVARESGDEPKAGS
jgi:uncharacterized membrane protein